MNKLREELGAILQRPLRPLTLRSEIEILAKQRPEHKILSEMLVDGTRSLRIQATELYQCLSKAETKKEKKAKPARQYHRFQQRRPIKEIEPDKKKKTLQERIFGKN